jgi:hypothetical protein
MPPPFQGGGIKKLWKACQPRASPARSMSAVRRGSLIVERRDGHLNQSDLPAYVRRKSKIMSLYHKCPKCGVFGVPGEHKCDQERTSNTQSSTQSKTQSSSSASASSSSDIDWTELFSYLLLWLCIVLVVYSMLWGREGLWGEEGYFAEKEKERAAEYEERCGGCPPERPIYYGNESRTLIIDKQNRYEAEIRSCESRGCRM